MFDLWRMFQVRLKSSKLLQSEHSDSSVLLRKAVHIHVQPESMHILACARRIAGIDRHVLFRHKMAAFYNFLGLLQPQLRRRQRVRRDSRHRRIRSHLLSQRLSLQSYLSFKNSVLCQTLTDMC